MIGEPVPCFDCFAMYVEVVEEVNPGKHEVKLVGSQLEDGQIGLCHGRVAQRRLQIERFLWSIFKQHRIFS